MAVNSPRRIKRIEVEDYDRSRYYTDDSYIEDNIPIVTAPRRETYPDTIVRVIKI